MDYILYGFLIYIALNILLVIVHDFISLILDSDQEYMFFLLPFGFLMVIAQSLSSPIEFIKSLLKIFVMPPIVLTSSIYLMFVNNKYDKSNKLSKPYQEYFRHEINLEKNTLLNLEILLKNKNIKYKHKYLINFTTYLMKTIHDYENVLIQKQNYETTKIYNLEDNEYYKEIVSLMSKKMDLKKEIIENSIDIIMKDVKFYLKDNPICQNGDKSRESIIVNDNKLSLKIRKPKKFKSNIKSKSISLNELFEEKSIIEEANF